MKLNKLFWVHFAVAGFTIKTSILLVIRQKGKSQNGCFKKTKHTKFSEKQIFPTPWYAHACVDIRGLDMFVFWKIWHALFSWNTCFEIRLFALLPPISSFNILLILYLTDIENVLTFQVEKALFHLKTLWVSETNKTLK